MHVRHDKNNSHYAVLLIIFGFTFLIYGSFLNLVEDRKIYDPSSVVLKSDEGKKNVDINRTSSDEKSNENNLKDSNTKEDDTVDYYTQSNVEIIKKIKEDYGITVKYGSDIKDYSAGNVNLVLEKDSYVINNALEKLQEVLLLYPTGFFDEIKSGGIPLSIYLVDSFSDPSVTGITDSNYSYAIISIAISYPFEDSFFHESYHYIERYMLKKGINYNGWLNLNPSDFNYGNTNKNYSYAFTHSEDSYFVNSYAQYSAEEDRASTFEYMMSKSKALCLNSGTPIWNKATLIEKTIEAVFKTVKPNVTEYWERYL